MVVKALDRKSTLQRQVTAVKSSVRKLFRKVFIKTPIQSVIPIRYYPIKTKELAVKFTL